jgi:two-component system OmpR family response regulator
VSVPSSIAAPVGGGDLASAPPIALVIEDDPDVAELLRIVLSEVGFAVLVAANGTEGTALAREHRPVLATIDVAMPQMDGLEATRRIREFSDAYIVIISTRSEERDVLAGFDAGADDYVPKPIRPRELQARLAAVARRPLPTAEPVVAQPAGWAPAAEDTERSAYHRRIVAGEPVDEAAAGEPMDQDPHEPEDDGRDGRDGMVDVGMRFVGSWIEFRGLRINPARNLVVVDDRLVDLPQEHVDLLEILMYSGTRTLSARHLALRLRGQTEETATTTRQQDQRWIEALMASLFSRLEETGPASRWIEALPQTRFRLVRAG